MARNAAAMAAMPAANPSILSSRLSAFVMPITQTKVIAMLTAGVYVHGKFSP